MQANELPKHKLLLAGDETRSAEDSSGAIGHLARYRPRRIQPAGRRILIATRSRQRSFAPIYEYSKVSEGPGLQIRPEFPVRRMRGRAENSATAEENKRDAGFRHSRRVKTCSGKRPGLRISRQVSQRFKTVCETGSPVRSNVLRYMGLCQRRSIKKSTKTDIASRTGSRMPSFAPYAIHKATKNGLSGQIGAERNSANHFDEIGVSKTKNSSSVCSVAKAERGGDVFSKDQQTQASNIRPILEEYFSRQARLPPSGGSGFDPRLTPVWAGLKLPG